MPLVIFLFVIMKIVLRERLKNFGTIMYGIIFAVVGMMIFNIGLTYGLSKLGGQSGSLIPSAFCTIESGGTTIAALYPYFAGVGGSIFCFLHWDSALHLLSRP